MVTIRIDKPKLDRKTPEENIALVDKWIAETAERLNTYIMSVNRKLEELEKGEEE